MFHGQLWYAAAAAHPASAPRRAPVQALPAPGRQAARPSLVQPTVSHIGIAEAPNTRVPRTMPSATGVSSRSPLTATPASGTNGSCLPECYTLSKTNLMAAAVFTVHMDTQEVVALIPAQDTSQAAPTVATLLWALHRTCISLHIPGMALRYAVGIERLLWKTLQWNTRLPWACRGRRVPATRLRTLPTSILRRSRMTSWRPVCWTRPFWPLLTSASSISGIPDMYSK